jgi:hypothetical protein
MSCECGCGESPNPGKRFVNGHQLPFGRRVQREAQSASAFDRAMSRIEPLNNGCWRLRKSRSNSKRSNDDRYAVIASQGKQVLLHRFLYEKMIGPIPTGLDLDHLCRNPWCVNPCCGEPVTERENTLRGEGPAAINARKTVCPRGHPFDRRKTSGERWCSICAKAAKKRYKAKLRLLGVSRLTALPGQPPAVWVERIQPRSSS